MGRLSCHACCWTALHHAAGCLLATLQVLAGAALAAGGDLAEAGKEAVEAGVRQGQKKQKKKRARKPWLARQVEGLFKPYSGKGRRCCPAWHFLVACMAALPTNRPAAPHARPAEKYHAAGFMMYRGFNRMGKRMERGAAILGKHLDGAVRAEVEVEALQGWSAGTAAARLLPVRAQGCVC